MRVSLLGANGASRISAGVLLSKPFAREKAKTKHREETIMFRKIMIATVASLALFTAFAMPAQTEAREVHRGHDAHRTYRTGHRYHGAYRGGYRVYYRACGTTPWRFDASYGRRPDAAREAQVMRARGFETVIR
jgi:hypothetical protein